MLIRTHLRSTALVVLAGAVALVAGGMAWACVPMPFMSVQPRASGEAGSEVTVTGASFPGPVDLRWNGHDGPLLASAEGPDFSTVVKIPEASAGLYVVFGVAHDPGGGITATASAAFQVIAPSGSGPTKTRAPLNSGTAPASPSASSSNGVGTVTLVSAGVLLVSLTVLAGLLVVRRRRSSGTRAGARHLL